MSKEVAALLQNSLTENDRIRKRPLVAFGFAFLAILGVAVLDWAPGGSSRHRPSDHAGMDSDRDGCGHLLRCAGTGAVYQSHDCPLAEDSCTDFRRKLSESPGRGRAAAGLRTGALNTLTVGSHSAEFLNDLLVAAVDVVATVDDGLPFRDEASADEARTGTKIGGLDHRARQLRGSVNDRAMAVDGNVRAHTHHFACMQETVFENGLADDGSALSLRG